MEKSICWRCRPMEEKNKIIRKCKGKSNDAFISELERTY